MHPPKKPPTSAIIADSRNTRQSAVLLREVTRLRFEALEKTVQKAEGNRKSPKLNS